MLISKQNAVGLFWSFWHGEIFDFCAREASHSVKHPTVSRQMVMALFDYQMDLQLRVK